MTIAILIITAVIAIMTAIIHVLSGKVKEIRSDYLMLFQRVEELRLRDKTAREHRDKIFYELNENQVRFQIHTDRFNAIEALLTGNNEEMAKLSNALTSLKCNQPTADNAIKMLIEHYHSHKKPIKTSTHKKRK